MKNPKNIVITGASSGLGAALAVQYAAPGVKLFLQGRNLERLQMTAEKCRERGADVTMEITDVTDMPHMEGWLTSVDRSHPVDLVIANAGISAGTGIHGEDGKQVNEIFATNIGGVINTVQPLIPGMVARRRGQIAVMSSLAGMRGLPSCPAYSASKACVKAYGEGLRGWLSDYGVQVSVVCPGYIKTPMTEVNDFPMPFLMSPEKAAGIIAKRLEWNQSRIAFPLALHIPLWLASCLSPTLTDWFFARLPAKPASGQ